MKNRFTLFAICFCLYQIPCLVAAQSTNGNGSSNGRENWFPNRGNVGIGTRSPSENLEVIGNIKATDNIFTPTLNATDVKSSSLLIFNDAIINGRLGIGVGVPTEKLHVLGNFKLEGDLSAYSLNIQNLSSNTGTFNVLTVNQNSIFNGLVGIGTSAPTQKLHVVGNALIENDLFSNKFTTKFVKTDELNAGISSFSENVTFAKDGYFGGKLGIGVPTPSEMLDVSGNIKSGGILFSSSLNTGAAELSSLGVSQNATFSGLVGIGTTAPQEKLHVQGNLKVDNAIFSNALSTSELETSQLNATGLASFGNSASFAKDVTVIGKLGIGVPVPSESLDINGNAKLSGEISAGKGVFTQSLAAGNTSVNGNLQVSGSLTSSELSGDALAVSGTGTITGGLNAGGNSKVNNLTVVGNLNAEHISIKEINTSGDASVAQNLTVAQDLTVAGAGQVGGNLSVNGNLKAGIIEANEFRKADGSPLLDLDNAVVSQTLIVGSDKAIPSNYKLAVGGNIIATGIDIKIPEKWPDYVFTDGYKLLTIEEVALYIKKHGHLPGILSAEEMTSKENYSVSEMDAKLLEKVEELTLYIIELKSEIDSLKKEACKSNN